MSAGPRAPSAFDREQFVASKRVSRLLQQSLLGILVVMLAGLPLSLGTPDGPAAAGVLMAVHAVGAACVCLALSLRTQHQPAALNLTTLGVFAVSIARLANSGLRGSAAALLLLVIPILLLGVAHHRRGVLVATALALAAVLMGAGLELQYARAAAAAVLPDELVGQLLLRTTFALLTLGGVGFLVDRFLAILREREEFLAGVFTNIETSVLVYDVDEKGESYVAAMNPACAEILGLNAAEIVGKRRTDLKAALTGTPMTSNPDLRQKLALLARSTSLSSGEIRLHVDGVERQYWIVAAPQLNDAGQVMRVVLSGTDISAHRQAERQLSFQADVLASINDAVLAVDREGLVTYMNRAAERLYQQPAERCLGIALAKLAGADFHLAVQAHAVDPSESSPVGSGQFSRSDDVQVPVEFTVSTLRDESNQIVGTLAVIRDVTERRQLQAQLVQAQKQEALGRLAGGVAHDFNNLLVVIRGGAEFVRGDLPADHPSQPDLLEVMRAADRAAGLVRQLLAFARRQPPTPRSVNLDQVLHDLTYMLRRLIREEIELRVDIVQDLWSVQIDVAQLEQVIVNLLVNARDAIPAAGHITLEARNAQVTSTEARTLAVVPGDYVLIRVRDDGMGMNAETMKHIFEPFFSTKNAGTGLGLAVCYGIIKQLGGGIVAQSATGQGAEFTVALPRSLTPARSRTAPLSLDLPRGTETILLVEDDQAVRDLAARVLRTQGYRVYEAADGAAALARAAELGEEPIDLLFTDVVLPQMRGQELAQTLGKSRPGMPVLLASGYGDSNLSPVAAADGVRAFLAKPYGPAALLQRVREVLDAVQRGPTPEVAEMMDGAASADRIAPVAASALREESGPADEAAAAMEPSPAKPGSDDPA